jgi:alpha-mannosidase
LPHAGHFLDSDVPIAAYLFNSPLHGAFLLVDAPTGRPAHTQAVRHIAGTSGPLTSSRPLFVVDGAPNVILETIKRGEDDDFEKKTGGTTSIVLRLYEAFGGHARAQLRLPGHIPITRVHLTNLLEDDGGDDLRLTRSENGESAAVLLNFRGFEVKTVKLVLGAPGGKVVEQSG